MDKEMKDLIAHLTEAAASKAEAAIQDESAVRAVQALDLIQKNRDYLSLLECIVAVEEAVGAAKGWGDPSVADGKPWGWTMDDIRGLTGGHLHQLETTGLVRRAYSSNNHLYLRAADVDALKKAVEAARERKAEQEAWDRLEGGSGFLKAFQPSEQEALAYREVLADHDGLDYWADAVAPKVVGLERCKKAVLLALASTTDRHESKNRVHVLLWGPPETGKTAVARVAARLGGGWSSGAGRRTSKVGLTADASGQDLTPGILPRHHQGAVGVDELDKFAGEDQSGLLEAMEEGVVTINLGKFSTQLDAEVIVVATANHVAPLSPELVSRFDLVVHTALPSVEQAQAIAQDVITWWDRPKARQTVNLGAFLAWVREYEPEIPDTVRGEAVRNVNRYIRMGRETRPRRIESILRVAKSVARLNHRDVAREDVDRAIDLIAEMNDREEGSES